LSCCGKRSNDDDGEANPTAESESTLPVDWEAAEEDLALRGHFVVPKPMQTATASALVEAVAELEAAGWPAAFVWMYDEPWHHLCALWEGMEGLLGGEAVLEPSVFAYALRKPPGRQERAEEASPPSTTSADYVGSNFGLPHRDYSHDESYSRDGELSTITLWIPLTDATIDNGCVYVLPREFDTEFDASSSKHHMRVASETAAGTELAFNLAGARPLLAAPGQALGWTGNLIHWGSQCASDTKAGPRRSLGCVFRHPSAFAESREADGANLLAQGLTKERCLDMGLSERCKVICKSLLAYQAWYTLGKEALPGELLALAAGVRTAGA